MKKRAPRTILMAALAVWFMPPSVSAQSLDAEPALGVARVSLVNGDVTTRRGEAGDWIAADVNSPLVEGDLVETGPGARTEIQLDYSNFLRLDGATQVELASLGNRSFRIRLLQGRVTYSELKGGEADVDVETEFVAVRPQKNGRYEVEARSGVTVIQVRRGEAEVASPQGTEKVRRGRMLVVRDGPNGLELQAEADEPRGDWDRWNESRDDRLADAESYRYVDSSIAGAHDLDDHGDWRYVSGYGHCWVPRVHAGWAPYRTGRWSWVGSYGWSWVGYEPWGWAPYHYGSWFNHASFGWTWYPGRRNFRHYWSPARVAFFGYSGRNFSLGLGFGYGNVGWIPLAPGERGYRWWGGGRGYYNNRGGDVRIKNSTIIVDNSTNIYNNYRNARAHNGVTVVDSQSFAQGRVNNPRGLRSGELQRASLMRGQIPVVPARASQGRVVRAGGAASARNTTASNRSARSGQSVRAAARPSFDQQQSRVAQSVREFRTGRAGTTDKSNTGVRAGTSGRDPRAGSVRSSSAASPSRSRTGDGNTRTGISSRAGASNSGRTVAPVDRANGVVRSSARSGTDSRIPQRSSSRVDRSSSRSGSSSRGTVAPRSDSRIPQRSSSRAETSQRSAPSVSRRSSPAVRSAPSRTRSSGGFSGRTSAPRSAPSVRSAPSRSSGGGSRTAPSRSSGGSRSAPSRGRAPSRSK